MAKQDVLSLRELANAMVRDAARANDPDSISLTIIGYSLSKILQKQHFREDKRWASFLGRVMDNLAKAAAALEAEDLESMRKALQEVFGAILALDAEAGHHVNWVIDKARIKNASTLYAIGFSLGMSSSLTGASMWEVMDYAGKTRIVDEEKVTRPVSSRLLLARKLFGVGSP